MTTLPDGSYHYYINANNDKMPPLVCEIFLGWVYQTGEPHGRPLSDYKYGRFVRLIEAPDQEPAHQSIDSNANIV